MTILNFFRLKFIDPNATGKLYEADEAFVTYEMALVDDSKRNAYGNTKFDKPATVKIRAVSHVVYFPKHSYLKQPVDDQITYINENGLSDKWNAPYKLSAIYDDNVGSIPRQLNISQFIGIIEVCCGLILLAIVIFVFEILSPYWNEV